jgi:undecaprenyl-diphosphatase
MVRADAARFSFLLGVPLILSAGLLGLVDIIQSDPTRSELITLAVGLLCSTISGFVAISGLLRFLQHSSTLVFAVYRTVVGISLLLLILTNLR